MKNIIYISLLLLCLACSENTDQQRQGFSYGGNPLDKQVKENSDNIKKLYDGNLDINTKLDRLEKLVDSLIGNDGGQTNDPKRPQVRDIGDIDVNSYDFRNIRPEYLKPYTERIEGNTVVRISGKSEFGCDCSQLRHRYAKNQPWNADGTMIMTSGWPARIIDGNTYEDLGTAHCRAIWSNTEPRITYDAGIGKIFRRDIVAQTETVVRNFPEYSSEMSLGNGEGNLSNDDRLMVLIGRLSNGTRDILVYDMHSDTVVSKMNVGTNAVDWAGVSQLGGYVVVVYGSSGSGSYRGSKSYDINLKNERHLYNGTPHGDLGIDAQGNEVFVTRTPISGYMLSMADLGTGQVKGVLPKGGNKSLYGGHVSCRNIGFPGWALVSEQGHATDMGRSSFNREAFAVRLDQSGKVMRFAKHDNNIKSYLHDAQAVPNRDMTKVLFASNRDIAIIKSQQYPEMYVCFR